MKIAMSKKFSENPKFDFDLKLKYLIQYSTDNSSDVKYTLFCFGIIFDQFIVLLNVKRLSDVLCYDTSELNDKIKEWDSKDLTMKEKEEIIQKYDMSEPLFDWVAKQLDTLNVIGSHSCMFAL